jgi:hypothetical protein
MVCPVIALPAAADDQGSGLPGSVQEMVAGGDHASHCFVFQNDNKEVWIVIRYLTQGGNARDGFRSIQGVAMVDKLINP